MREPVAVWDGPTRLFHWSLALSVAAAWITAGRGDGGAHLLFGSLAGGLLAFRVVWGVVGSETARFAEFVDAPAALRAWVRGAGPRRWGHNPLAGWAVLALLAGAGWATLSGLAAHAPDGAAAHGRAANILGLLIALHVAAIFAYQGLRGENLLGPMLGARVAPAPDAPPPPKPAEPGRARRAAAVGVAAAAALYALGS